MPLNVSYTGTDAEQTKIDPVVKAFLDMSPTEVGNYIDTQVTDLASAKDILKIIGKILKVAAEEIQELKRK